VPILLIAAAAADVAYPLLCALPPALTALAAAIAIAVACEQEASCDLVFIVVVALKIKIKLHMLCIRAILRILVYGSPFPLRS
jgi:hypothetical protein